MGHPRVRGRDSITALAEQDADDAGAASFAFVLATDSRVPHPSGAHFASEGGKPRMQDRNFVSQIRFVLEIQERV
jgi:hypothetical protein